MEYPLYTWQKECLNAWTANDYHGIVNVVTGGGKTYLALAAAGLLDFASLRVKIVVPTASLLAQWTSAILDFFGPLVSREDIGCYYGGHQDPAGRKYMIYIINSARYTLARHILKDFSDGLTVFLIADECHHYTSAENRKIFDFLSSSGSCPNRYASLGLSATPGTDTAGYESVLVPALGREIYRYGFADAARRQTLCRFALFQIALSFRPDEAMEYQDLSDRLTRTFNQLLRVRPSLKGLSGSQFFEAAKKTAGGEGQSASLAASYLNLSYQRKACVSCASSRISCTLKLIQLLGQDTKILVFGERIRQADALYEQLDRLFPHQAARCHSAMDAQARKLALERYRDGEVRILISCRSLDEGFDIPSAQVGIILSSSSAQRQRTQRLGRVLRRFQGKDIACLYYLYIADSTEDATFFPDIPGDAIVCDLSYDEQKDGFLHPDYESAAHAAFASILSKDPDEALLKEAEKRFLQGVIQPDWLLGEERCEQKLAAARTTGERNYWLCMKQMTIARRSRHRTVT